MAWPFHDDRQRPIRALLREPLEGLDLPPELTMRYIGKKRGVDLKKFEIVARQIEDKFERIILPDSTPWTGTKK